jgi:dUTP pyrophosphatase
MASGIVEVVPISDAKPPKYVNGIYKVYASEAGSILPWRGGKIKAGFRLRIPAEYYARISASTVKVLGGVVDSDYRGEICVIVYNDSGEDFVYKTGDEIGEMSVLKIATPMLRAAVQ